jgi:hypothetical protein
LPTGASVTEPRFSPSGNLPVPDIYSTL